MDLYDPDGRISLAADQPGGDPGLCFHRSAGGGNNLLQVYVPIYTSTGGFIGQGYRPLAAVAVAKRYYTLPTGPVLVKSMVSAET